ncbi:hypothetical protein IPA_08800 [Ignicoccus pacificus DSM 13166]|uniref:Uncharacterized protein n=1 Tax=Ignicoccus pacificus DSM 13166 TaxID=940294 RepID=A0A977KBV3_9CREN|nr:hypothetical protein IPA_08800 [Ignicoccus pacificus DSM 13166]
MIKELGLEHCIIKGIKRMESIEVSAEYIFRGMMKFNASFSHVVYLTSPMLIVEAIAYAKNFNFNELGINHRTYNKYEGSIMGIIDSMINCTV